MPELTKEIAEYNAIQIFRKCEVDTMKREVSDGIIITIIPMESVLMDQVKAYEQATGTELKRLTDVMGGCMLRFYEKEGKASR